MNFLTAYILFFLSNLASAQWWGHDRMPGWDDMAGGMGDEHHWGDCAASCLTSAYPSDSTSWAKACATPAVLSKCISSACSNPASSYSIISVQSSMCSVYSRCSSAALSQDTETACSAWGFWGPCDGDWNGGHDMGWFTITGSAGQTTGWATTTQKITTTLPGGSVDLSTMTKTATVVAAAATTATGASGTAVLSSGASTGLGKKTNALGALALGVAALPFLC